MAEILITLHVHEPQPNGIPNEQWYSHSYAWGGPLGETLIVECSEVEATAKAFPAEVYWLSGHLFIGPYELQVIGYIGAYRAPRAFVCVRVL